jgi:hypothetical protein
MVSISAIDVLFPDHPKCLDLMFIYVSGLMISIGNLELLKLASIAEVKFAVKNRPDNISPLKSRL